MSKISINKELKLLLGRLDIEEHTDWICKGIFPDKWTLEEYKKAILYNLNKDNAIEYFWKEINDDQTHFK